MRCFALVALCALIAVVAVNGQSLNPPSQPRLVTAVIDCTPERRVSNGCCAASANPDSHCCTRTDSCTKDMVSYVPVIVQQASSSCDSKVVVSQCCRRADDSCCNRSLKPCYVEPEYRADECARRRVTVCCTRSEDTCCNQCGSSFSSNRFAETEAQAEVKTEVEAQAEVQTEAEAEAETMVAADTEYMGDCTETVRVTRCCATPAATCCARPCNTQGDPRIGSMQMGKLQVPQPTCSDPTGCGSSRRLVTVNTITHTDSDCSASRRESTCCSLTVRSCCNQCLGSNFVETATETETETQALAEVEAQAEAQTETEYMNIAPYVDPATGKKMIPATIVGCNEEKRASRCCSTDVEHYTSCCRPRSQCESACSLQVRTTTCCKSPTDTCCSQSACPGPIGAMQMGKLKTCDQEAATKVCCRSVTDACCNKMLVCTSS